MRRWRSCRRLWGAPRVGGGAACGRDGAGGAGRCGGDAGRRRRGPDRVRRLDPGRRGRARLQALRRFVERHLAGAINTLHLLPFFPWDTDRGFSVQDFRAVDTRNGTWPDIEALAREFSHLMVDLVINHASLGNPLVQGALTGDPRYRDFVIRYDDGAQPDAAALAKLTRPRPDPVLTRYFIVATCGHKRATFDPDAKSAAATGGWVWTTFSRPPNADGSAGTRQVDLNFRNPRVLLEMLEVLLCYRGHGADWVRLDAAGYMWKELGTPSIHHPNTHRLLQVLRDALSGRADLVSVAEVNEPQDTVLPYLGSADAGVECDLAYQFAHFPLAVHALHSGDARHYKRWLGTLDPFAGRQFITVFGSHDGMGRKPVLGCCRPQTWSGWCRTWSTVTRAAQLCTTSRRRAHHLRAVRHSVEPDKSRGCG